VCWAIEIGVPGTCDCLCPRARIQPDHAQRHHGAHRRDPESDIAVSTVSMTDAINFQVANDLRVYIGAVVAANVASPNPVDSIDHEA
jgi:hypothetical protein